LLPFVLLGLVVVHILALHQYGSNNPIGVAIEFDKVSLHPYFTIKDLFGVFIIFILYFYFVCFEPDFLNHPDNCIPANSMKTPVHITPE
jgi:quinol-cytochrome oxidoreductase complex cytochrome b subunit